MPGDPKHAAAARASRSPNTPQNRDRADLDYTGSVMPPPEAVAGTYVGPGRQEDQGRAADRRGPPHASSAGSTWAARSTWTTTPPSPQSRGYGWMLDDQRPTLTLTYPAAGANAAADAHPGRHARLLHRPGPGQLPGDGRLRRRRRRRRRRTWRRKFKPTADGVWELTLAKPLTDLPRGKLTVSVKDRQGNLTDRADVLGEDDCDFATALKGRFAILRGRETAYYAGPFLPPIQNPKPSPATGV